MPLPPETTTEWTADDERALQRWKLKGQGAHFARFAREIIRLRSERQEQDAEIAKLTEWRSSVLSRLEAMPEFRDATWAGDKRGWGYVFEFVGWLHSEVSALRSELSLSRSEDVAEIRRQRNAWRDYADHLDHCVECSQMGPIGDCFERKELQEATKCARCGGSARLLPDVECPICTEPAR
jgi:hypothetical protein